MKIKVICKVIQHGQAYGKTGDTIEVPDEIGAALVDGKRAEEIKAKPVKNEAK